jgi:hypothetical protein
VALFCHLPCERFKLSPEVGETFVVLIGLGRDPCTPHPDLRGGQHPKISSHNNLEKPQETDQMFLALRLPVEARFGIGVAGYSLTQDILACGPADKPSRSSCSSMPCLCSIGDTQSRRSTGNWPVEDKGLLSYFSLPMLMDAVMARPRVARDVAG